VIHDIAALSTHAAADDIGIAVPDELSVGGFDEIQSAGWQGAVLTTVAQPRSELASAIIAGNAQI
jgi:DNA-binding LacI/PurR family transcriptional regulator